MCATHEHKKKVENSSFLLLVSIFLPDKSETIVYYHSPAAPDFNVNYYNLD